MLLSRHRKTPLDVAKDAPCAALLRSLGGLPSLQCAARLALPDVLRRWLTEGADVEERDGSGATPLWLVVRGAAGGAAECIRLLLEAKATVDALPITQAEEPTRVKR